MHLHFDLLSVICCAQLFLWLIFRSLRALRLLFAGKAAACCFQLVFLSNESSKIVWLLPLFMIIVQTEVDNV